jgi:hypothetical protein
VVNTTPSGVFPQNVPTEAELSQFALPLWPSLYWRLTSFAISAYALSANTSNRALIAFEFSLSIYGGTGGIYKKLHAEASSVPTSNCPIHYNSSTQITYVLYQATLSYSLILTSTSLLGLAPDVQANWSRGPTEMNVTNRTQTPSRTSQRCSQSPYALMT